MKIVHLIDYFQPKIGFQETYLAKYHHKMGHEVIVVTSDRYYPYPDFEKTFGKILGKRIKKAGEFQEEGITVHRLDSLELPNSTLIYLKGLENKLFKLKPDIVFCHGMLTITSYQVSKLKKIIGFKLIYDNHAAYFNTHFKGFLKRTYKNIFQKIAVPVIKKNLDNLFAIGNEEQEFIADIYGIRGENIPIIRLGVDTDLFKFNQSKRKENRLKLRVGENDILIVFSGKIHSGKKIGLLIKAITQLNNKDIKLLLIGSGVKSYIDELKELGRSIELIMIDLVSPVQLAGYYAAADIACWPGDPSITMLEAMSCGLPLVVPDNSYQRYLRECRAVNYFKPDNELSLQIILDKTIKLVKAKQIDRKIPGEFVNKHLSWENIAQQSLDVTK